jgi:two-component system OmpR family sensor kinase
VEVRVADHGPGVPEAERTRIFEEFARVDARPDATGTGLGLAIVHALVTAHGGQVWCEETPGGGATFVFVLPARRVDAVREARA